MLGLIRHLNWDDHRTSLPSFFTISLMPFLHGIDNGILAGLAAHCSLVALEVVYSPMTKSKNFIQWARDLRREDRGSRPSSSLRRESAMGDFYETKIKTFRRTLRGHVKSKAELLSLFSQYDEDQQGALRSSDLARLAIAIGDHLTPEEIESVISMLDPTNEEEGLRFPQFADWISQSPSMRGSLSSPNDTWGSTPRHSTPKLYPSLGTGLGTIEKSA